MKRRITICLLIFSFCFYSSAHATAQVIEIFDCHKETVINKKNMNSDIQEIISNYVDNITTPYKKFNPLPSHGLMIKIPLNQPLNVSNQYFANVVDEVIIILPTNEKPYLLLFDDENYPHFYYFEGKLEKLEKKLGTTFNQQRTQ